VSCEAPITATTVVGVAGVAGVGAGGLVGWHVYDVVVLTFFDGDMGSDSMFSLRILN